MPKAAKSKLSASVCEYGCKLGSDSLAERRRHGWIHLSEAKQRASGIVCRTCNKVFSPYQQSNFEEHARVHTGAKVLCDYCPALFTWNKQLYNHAFKEHGYKARSGQKMRKVVVPLELQEPLVQMLAPIKTRVMPYDASKRPQRCASVRGERPLPDFVLEDAQCGSTGSSSYSPPSDQFFTDTAFGDRSYLAAYSAYIAPDQVFTDSASPSMMAAPEAPDMGFIGSSFPSPASPANQMFSDSAFVAEGSCYHVPQTPSHAYEGYVYDEPQSTEDNVQEELFQGLLAEVDPLPGPLSNMAEGWQSQYDVAAAPGPQTIVYQGFYSSLEFKEEPNPLFQAFIDKLFFGPEDQLLQGGRGPFICDRMYVS